MITKMFEVRDHATFIPVLAIRMMSFDHTERYLLRRVGYIITHPCVVVVKLASGEAHYDPHSWSGSPRTMPTAHQYIIDNFDGLSSGAVVDVRFILGETQAPAKSERFEAP